MNTSINKTLSRLFAVQILFQLDFNEKMNLDKLHDINNKEINEIYNNLKDINIGELKRSSVDKKWFSLLVTKVFRNRDKIDKQLSKKFVDDWSIDRMDSTLVNILRCAYIELVEFSNVPKNVVISEYTNIAASFFNKSEVNFVNGLLDKFSNDHHKG